MHEFTEEFGKDGLVETTAMLKASIEKHNLFGLYEASNFGLFPSKEELRELIGRKSNMLGLEVTERCNLRCTYCVHTKDNKEKRAHGNKNMSIETAFAAIDNLNRNSHDSQAVNIIFYGGEPLLNFTLIKKSIKYAAEVFKDRSLSFSMTTNSTHITPQIAGFLFAYKVNVKVSIDGPEDIHDRYRKDAEGKGSFQKALTGLKHLYDAYGDLFHVMISMNMVYAPPYSLDQIKQRINLWNEVEWLPTQISSNISYYSGLRLPGINHDEDISLFQWAYEEYCSKRLNEEIPHPFTKDLIEKSLAGFCQRTIYPKASDKFALNGCCIPGARRVFVTVDGDYKLCERISNSAPVIGNVKTGIDIDILYNEYIKSYGEMSLKSCKKCWAINVCDSCFIDGYDDSGMSAEKKALECKSIRSSTARKIFYFCRALEIIPNSLHIFQSINLT